MSDRPGSFQLISDGAGGTFIAFAEDRSYPSYAGPVYLVRLDEAGTVLWGPLQLTPSGATANRPRLCSDGGGGVYVAWAQDIASGGSQVYVQRVNSGGSIYWSNPYPGSNPSSIDSLAVAAGSQGMFLVYRTDVALFAAHINASGVLAAPGIGGFSLGTARTFGAQPCVVPDGSGGNGVIVAWSDVYKNIQVQNVVLSGGSTLSQAWGSGAPVTICSTTGDGFYPTLAQDGAGGALVSWTEITYLPSIKTEIRVQKVNSGGLPQWTANGVVLVDSSVVGGSDLWQFGETTTTVATDGSGGAYLAWNDWRNDSGTGNDDIYAQRVNGSGLPQWTPGGISASDYVPGTQRHPAMVSDLAGGALVTFEDYYGPSYDISMVKLTSTGKAWFRWVYWDSSAEKEDQKSPAIVYDGSGPVPKGCIVAWIGESAVGVEKVQLGGTTANLALQGTAIVGTESSAGVDTSVPHEGTAANINDGNLSTRVDTWNSTGTDPKSYVGIIWLQPQVSPVSRLVLTLATFGDGGWFGPNNQCPGPGGLLSPVYLSEPAIQVTTDGGATWTEVAHTCDYLTALNGHGIGGGAYPNPSSVTATFLLKTPVANLGGIRLVGSEGGIASSGFLGVFELAIFAFMDSDLDGMDDAWESAHALTVGVNDAAADPDGDRLNNLQEFGRSTDPQNPDTDNDKFFDGAEVQANSDPINAASIPNNVALRMDAAGILGTMTGLGGTATPIFHMGTAANINDGDLGTRVDSWNGTGTDPLSYVGIVWVHTQNASISCLRLDLATFGDGGWFGPNNQYPGPGGLLTPNHLSEPEIQITTDAGVTWTPVSHTSDYLTALNGHQISTSGWNPTLATAIFRLDSPVSGIKGIRLVGSEGGIASGGFLGVFELAALTKAPVKLLNPRMFPLFGEFRFQFDSQAGVTYAVQGTRGLEPEDWRTVDTIQGDGTRKTVVQTYTPSTRSLFYRVVSQ